MYLKVMDQQEDGKFTILRVGDRVTTGRPPDNVFVAVTHEFQDDLPDSYQTIHWLNPDTDFMEAAVFPYGTAYLMNERGSTLERL